MKKTLFVLSILLSIHLYSQDVVSSSAGNYTIKDTLQSLKKILPDTIVVAEVVKPAKWVPSSSVVIVSSPEIEKMMDMYVESNLESKTVQGYVIQIFYGRLQTAKEIQEAFLKLYPDETIEIEYDTPDYKVFVGQYMDINTAKTALGILKGRGSEYSGAFVRPKEIKIYNETK